MKIKLIQAGYENFTGLFGNIHFAEGVSEDVTSEIAATFGATLQCEVVSEVEVEAEVVPVAPVVTTLSDTE
ncbi:hypothetical protein LP414_27780 [Polaromonas sp. P1(28)-13]|nr:hypothetical protein LP414_27780 [Polaromonas sp. P1(28)-13]